MRFIEPMRSRVLRFELININDLIPGKFQRDLSKGLVNKIIRSTDYGFVIPLVVVDAGNGKFEVIDGQHRLETVRTRISDCELPCVIVPEDFKERPLLLNIEKGDNIKDKCTKVHSIYMWYFQNKPELEEKEILAAAGFKPHIFTLAFSYREYDLHSPSLVETAVKKFDSVLDDVMSLAIDERRIRAQKVADLEISVGEICDEYSIKDFNLKKAIISKSSMALWGRTRILGEDFHECISDLMNQINETDWSFLGR